MATEKNGFVNWKNIVDRLIYGAIILILGFGITVYAKMSIIPTLKASISKCWEKYGELDKRMDDELSCRENRRAIDDIKDELRILRERHMQ